MIGKRYTISSFKVSNDARQRIKFHQNLTFILPFCKRKEVICSAEFVDFGEGICLERKEKGSKETNKQNCERMSAGQSLQKILYDTTRSSFPSGLFLLASSFPFKKKKNDRFYNFGNWPVKITYFPLSGRNLNLISKNSIPPSLFIGILCEKSDELTCSSFAKRRRKVRSVALNLRYLVSSSFSKKITRISLAKIRRFSKISFRHFYNSLRLIYPRE